QLALGELAGDGLVDGGVVDPPDTMGRAVAVGHLAPGIARESRLDLGPGIAGVEGEDGGEVVASGAGEAEAVLRRAGLGALVGPDSLPMLGELDPGEEAAAGQLAAVRRRVVLLQRPDRAWGIVGEDALGLPPVEKLGGVLVGIAAGGVAGKV